MLCSTTTTTVPRLEVRPLHQDIPTLCLAVALGVILVIIGQRLRIPSIVLLLFGGVAFGPEGLGWIQPASLGQGLETVVSLAVAVILFEGGLTLDIRGYRRAPVVIRRLLTIGALITWLGTATAVWLLFDLGVGMSLMAGSLVIVTGPTVVSPLLRRLHIPERLHHVLYWEGVLIDAVGVFVAVLCYEYLTAGDDGTWALPIGRFGLRLLLGVGIGVAAGLCVAVALEEDLIPRQHINIFALAAALLTFGLAHLILADSGILAVVVAGLVVGIRSPPPLRGLRRFKLELTELGVGVVFVLLAAKLELREFADWRIAALLAVVILALRPMSVWLATWNRDFDRRSKVLLSWIAPRGIVAAAMASLFALRLAELGHPEAAYLETFTYAVIAATVTLQGLSAPWLARALGLEQTERRSWVLVGDAVLVEPLGRGLRQAGVPVVELTGADVLGAGPQPDDPRFGGAQAVLCANLTMLRSVWAMHRWGHVLTPNECYRWATTDPGDSLQGDERELAGRKVWASGQNLASIADGITSGTLAIDVVEVGDVVERGRFGAALQPLFWVREGRADIVVDEQTASQPRGDLAVVLRRRIAGLAELVLHVDLVDQEEPTFEGVLHRLTASAQRQLPDIRIGEVVQGIIDRRQTMPAAVGDGIAIPHGYADGLAQSVCFLAAVPHGISDMVTPDNVPVRLVFLLVSPLGRAQEHLASLAILASLGRDDGFVDLICSQGAPTHIAKLLAERA